MTQQPTDEENFKAKYFRADYEIKHLNKLNRILLEMIELLRIEKTTLSVKNIELQVANEKLLRKEIQELLDSDEKELTDDK